MDEPRGAFPPADVGRAIWERLRDDDPTASSDLIVAYLDPLIAALTGRFPRTDPDDCASAAADALVSLVKNPRSYDPERAPLDRYLRLAARRDLQNLRAKERRRTGDKPAVSWEDVELSPGLGKYVVDEYADPARIVELAEVIAERLAAETLPAVVRAGLSPDEARVWGLLRQGERRTGAFARALGLEHRPVAEQRREVKRVKDRLKKRIERAGGDDG